jgi:hypothetical protein
MTEADHQRLSEPNLRIYCEVLARFGSHKAAADAIGCTTTTTRKWRNRSRRDPKNPKYMILPDPLGDPDEEPTPFHQAVDEALQDWCDSDLRETLHRQATGYDDPVIFQGRQAYVQDTSGGLDKMRIDPVTGMAHWPPKLDADGQPIPLTIRKINTPILQQVSKAHLPEYREKTEIDVTSGGKPIFFPAKSASVEDFVREAGISIVTAEKPDAS